MKNTLFIIIGFVERFIRTVKVKFFKVALHQKFFESVAALQVDIDTWLVHYNSKRPHRGYGNMGRRPFDTVTLFQETVWEEG